MIEVKLNGLSSQEVMGIVYEMREAGYKQSIDFDFEFYQSRWDEMIGEIPRQTKFTFYNEKYATMFILKYR
jgi:hypothetical protein